MNNNILIQAPRKSPLAISYDILLSVHLVLPLLIIVALLDLTLLDNTLLPNLALTPAHFLIYLIFFELPHIIASFFSWADKEYLQYHRKRVFVVLPLLLLATFALIQINLPLALFALVVYTMYHVITQQTGIAGMIMKKRHPLHLLWSLSAVLTASIGYAVIFTPFLIDASIGTSAGMILLYLSIIPFALLSIYMLKDIPAGIGRQYFIATTLAVVTSYFLLVLGYFLLAVLALRVVHDITAFIFYSAHDHNRNTESSHNVLYRALIPFGIPLFLLVPFIAIVIAFPLQAGGGLYTTSITFGIIVGFAHYYLEGFAWKRDGIHRKQLVFNS